MADGVDTVISAIGITGQPDGVGYAKVDGNIALLREAEAGLRRFVHASVLHGETLRRRVRLVASKEQFADELTASPLHSTVIRPTGFFSDMNDFYRMATRGHTFVIGDGRNFITRSPVPTCTSNDDIAKLAFYVAGHRPKAVHLPRRPAKATNSTMSDVTAERVTALAQFLFAC